jgi:hypothetical protein
MKTTLDIDDAILIKAKATAAQERTTLTRLVEEGLSLRLRGEPRRKPGKIKLPLSPSRGGLRPGIDPSSNRAMFDAADEDP